MNQPDIERIVEAVLAELRNSSAAGDPPSAGPDEATTSAVTNGNGLVIDLPDPTVDERRHEVGVELPADPDGLRNLVSTTSARVGVGRAGPRPRTRSLLLFRADHGVTQDAIHGTVDEDVKERFDLFTVQTRAGDREEYLLRPDLGRLLDDGAKALIDERCVKNPQVQIVVGDGLSAAAINNNLDDVLPVVQQGLTSAGISLGTPFFVENCRVGLMNDINEIVHADVVLLLIGERPGLGIADAMSAYMGWRPAPGRTDAQRDLVCMITRFGGTNPVEAGAFVVELVRKTLEHKASGVELRQLTSAD